jgi:hypothetical protein
MIMSRPSLSVWMGRDIVSDDDTDKDTMDRQVKQEGIPPFVREMNGQGDIP